MKLFTTLFLTLCTASLTYWLVLDLLDSNKQPSLDASGAVIPGNRLFDNPNLLDRDTITISKKGLPEHSFKLNRNQIWEYTAPFKDRASGITYVDPLLTFTTNAEVIEAIPLDDDINLDDYGFKENWIKVSVTDIHNEIAASYKIGMDSAWKHRVYSIDENGKEVSLDFPCTYIIKEDEHADNMLYLVADPTLNIRSLFDNDFSGFRDHRPFALNRKFMEEISIKQSNKEIVIEHSNSQSPWRISKPLDLEMDNKALTKLMVGISNLRAVKLHPIGSITLPQETDNLTQVSIKNFSSDERITLKIYPPANENANTTYATITDRDVIFELPTRPIEGFKSSVATLPSSVNELRARHMLNLNRANVRGFIIRQNNKPPIIIARPAAGSNYELLTLDNQRVAPNDAAIANLIAVISKEPVKEFVSDAATDLSIYDFHNPILTIDIRPLAGRPQKLLFSRQGDTIYAHLQGTTVVWEISQDSFTRIARNEAEWKSNQVWNLVKNDIIQFSIHQRGRQKVTVNYDYLTDSADAKVGTKDSSDQLNPLQAKLFINNNCQLNARRRLGPDNEQAINALSNPVCRVTITSQLFDDFAMPSEQITNTLLIAKASERANRVAFYYAKSSNDPDYFTISPATYYQLTTDVFAEE